MPRWASIFLLLPAAAALSGFSGLPPDGAWIGKGLCLLLVTACIVLGVLALFGPGREEGSPPP